MMHPFKFQMLLARSDSLSCCFSFLSSSSSARSCCISALRATTSSLSPNFLASSIFFSKSLVRFLMSSISSCTAKISGELYCLDGRKVWPVVVAVAPSGCKVFNGREGNTFKRHYLIDGETYMHAALHRCAPYDSAPTPSTSCPTLASSASCKRGPSQMVQLQ